MSQVEIKKITVRFYDHSKDLTDRVYCVSEIKSYPNELFILELTGWLVYDCHDYIQLSTERQRHPKDDEWRYSKNWCIIRSAILDVKELD